MNSILNSLPINLMLDSIDIEVSGICNANCVFCPRKGMVREKTVLSPRLFESLLREICDIHPDGPRAVFFCGFGEPLVNKNICSYAEIMNSIFPDALITVTSNGSLLNKEICDSILTSPIYVFSCSMQSIRKDRYDAYMRSGGYESTMRWMKYLAEKRWESGLQVAVTYVRTDQTDDEITEYHDFWGKLGVQVTEIRLHNRGGFICGEEKVEPRLVKQCLLHNSRLFIAANGDVLACCHDLDGQSKLGTIGIDSLRSILEKKMSRMKEGRLYPMCGLCNDESAGIIT